MNPTSNEIISIGNICPTEPAIFLKYLGKNHLNLFTLELSKLESGVLVFCAIF